MTRWILPLALCLLAGACFRAGFDIERSPEDAAGQPDAARDLVLDRPGHEATVVQDQHVPDHQPLDLKPPDLKPGPDVATPTTAPCQGPAKPTLTYRADMVLCASSSSGFNQCGGYLFCNVGGGWRNCTASEFLARGGKTTAATSGVQAWIKGNLRTASTPLHLPMDTYSSCADQQATSLTAVAWTCNTSALALQTQQLNLGISTYQSCRTLGPGPTAAAAAYWIPHPAYAVLSAAVCCY